MSNATRVIQWEWVDATTRVETDDRIRCTGCGAIAHAGTKMWARKYYPRHTALDCAVFLASRASVKQEQRMGRET